MRELREPIEEAMRTHQRAQSILEKAEKTHE